VPAAGRKFHSEIRPQVAIKFLQRFDEKEVQGEPNRSTPVGVSAEEARLRLSWLVIHPVLISANVQDVRIVPVVLRQRANAVRREKLLSSSMYRSAWRNLSASTMERSLSSLFPGILHGTVFMLPK